MRKVLLFLTMAALLSGCTTFTHSSKDPKEFARDRKECEKYVKENPGPDATCSKDASECASCEDVKRCLEQKGWKRVKG